MMKETWNEIKDLAIELKEKFTFKYTASGNVYTMKPELYAITSNGIELHFNEFPLSNNWDNVENNYIVGEGKVVIWYRSRFEGIYIDVSFENQEFSFKQSTPDTITEMISAIQFKIDMYNEIIVK